MASDMQQEKALKYIREGKVKAEHVGPEYATFRCSGSEVYTTAFYPGIGWACTCPSRKTECAHVYACKLVTDLHVDPALVTLTKRDEEIDDLLGGS